MNQYCTFYIVRHGESVANITQDYGIDAPLTPEGKLQVQKRAKELSRIHFDKIFSSDMLRAKQTAEILGLEHKLEIHITQAMRERNYGILEGTNRDRWEEKTRGLYLAWYNKEYKERLNEKIFEGMESDEEIISRALLFLRETAIAYPGKTILVVTHGDLMQALLVHLGYGRHKEFNHGAIQNTSYCIVRSDGIDFFVEGTKDMQLHQHE